MAETVTRRPWWQVVGPWPIRPGLLTVVGLMYYLTFRAGQEGGLILRPDTVGPIVIPGAFAGVVVYALAWLGRTWQQQRGVHWLNYMLTLVAITAGATLLRISGLIGIEVEGTTANIQAALRLLITFIVTSAVSGVVVDRLERQVAATEAALLVAREQQVQIIAADEDARRQVSELLHDGVQSALLSSCLELRVAMDDLDEARRPPFADVAERLERLRSIDVRQAARALSPHLEDVDLRTAIQDLASQYDGAFSTDVDLDPTLERWLQDEQPLLALAIYRIVEQALLNVAAHADASAVHVAIERRGPALMVTVEDDGRGLPPNAGRGLGSTIITTWVRAAGGSWSICGRGGPDSQHGGTILKAEVVALPPLRSGISVPNVPRPSCQ